MIELELTELRMPIRERRPMIHCSVLEAQRRSTALDGVQRAALK